MKKQNDNYFIYLYLFEYYIIVVKQLFWQLLTLNKKIDNTIVLPLY